MQLPYSHSHSHSHSPVFFVYVLALLLVHDVTVVSGYDNGLAITPQMGWNPWNRFKGDINETLIIEMGQAMIDTGLNKLGYEYVNLDDCWQISRNSSGYIQEDKTKFPSGMRYLRDQIHSLGTGSNLKFGLYSDSGTLTCQKRPGSFGYEDKDAASYAEWKIDYLKYDNCNGNGMGGGIRARYQTMHDALNATNHPILFSMCEWGVQDPATWAGPIGNSWRTTGDIRANWNSITSNLDKNNNWYMYAGPGQWNDPDILEVGNIYGDLTIAEQRSHFTLWCLIKAPLLLGNDLRSIPPEIMEIISNPEIIALNQDPLGKQGYRRWSSSSSSSSSSSTSTSTSLEYEDTNNKMGVEVWAGDLAGGDVAVVLFNRSNKTESITAKFSDVTDVNVYMDVDIGASIYAHVRNLWEHSGLGVHHDKVSVIVPSHDVVALRLTNITVQRQHQQLLEQ
jgi:alpha-galactosidase